MTAYQETSPKPESLSVPKRVLIVEDDDAVVSLYSRVLADSRYHISRAANGEEALSLMAQSRFDAILSDLVMPGMGGVDLLRCIRERGEDVPFVIVTGRPEIESAIMAVECGALRYLRKPLLPRDLRETVASALEVHEAKRLARPPRPGVGPNAPAKTTDGPTESEFREALDGLYMVYQPIVNPTGRSVVGYEALVRTRHPRLSGPAELLDAAARLGSYDGLGRRVRRIVAEDIERLPSDSLVFVNLHAEELFDESLYSEANPLRRHAARVVFELTEQGDAEGVEPRIAALRERKFLVAVDDLGAGYSGLSRLIGLAPDFVKMDGNLVRGIDSSTSRRALISCLASACCELRIDLICEGVETSGEASCLLDSGATLLQGFFFARPQVSFSPDDRNRLTQLMEELRPQRSSRRRREIRH